MSKAGDNLRTVLTTKPPNCPYCEGEREWSGKVSLGGNPVASCLFCGKDTVVMGGAGVASSVGGAMSHRATVVFTGVGVKPRVHYQKGNEAEVLQRLVEHGVIEAAPYPE